ncbi:MICAL-like protein 1 isoform X2 [Fopius arisanus]|nr:PREDICTED: MICAL-like protein 1 isoform X2 [Fopius arisanus]XP_011308714.1 PREDICTED: MICAL-like protein 1 isoform X2 [Fopius arisanus]
MPRRLGMRREICAVCALPVFLAEKLVITRRTYHRTCFKCARCTNQLTPGNFYETEDGDYCCETCPDEDKSTPLSSPPSTTLSTPSIPSTPLPIPRSLSDEEKTKNKHEKPSKTTRMRLDFMSHQLDSSTVDSISQKTPSPVSHVSAAIESPGECNQSPRDNLSTNDNDNHEVDITSVELNVDDDVIVCKNTKETLGVDNNDDVDEASQCLSVVQQRLKIFERMSVDGELRRKNNLCDVDNNVDEKIANDDSVEPDSLELLESPRVIEQIEVKVEDIDAVDDNQPADNEPIDKKDDVGVLNATGIDLSSEYPEDMNPFNSDDNDEEVDTSEVLKAPKASTNPFDSSDDEEESRPTPAARRRNDESSSEPVKRRLQAPHINLNPFWSDDEEGESDDETPKIMPVPKPRTIRDLPGNLQRAGLYASSSSLASSSSTTTTPGGTYRKRKPAPPPPVNNERLSTPAAGGKSPQPSHKSPLKTPRPRKSKPAPPPPLPTEILSTLSLHSPSWEEEKVSKNQSNKSKQSQRSPPPIDDEETFSYDKSSQGKWKRKKGPAPARPVPQRRKIKVMSMKDVKLELDEIEMQQQGLERQGVRLEQLIRDRCENDHDNESTRDDNMTMDVEELVLELFSLVNEKNELFRRQAELMLLKRQQRLEEEHADIEYQIRCLMCQPEATKTDFDKQREEKLIQRLVEIVERRSEIVECLEMDRRREVEEDKSINLHMGLYAAKSKGDLTKDLELSSKPHKSKKLKIKGIILDKHLKKIHKKDADKDVDETEVKVKRQNKKKWF